MNNIIEAGLQQLLVLSPLLLVYLTGMFLALILVRRHTGPSLLALIGLGVLLAVTMTQPFLTQYLIQERQNSGQTFESFGTILVAVNLLCNFLRAAGIGLLVAAVFVRRKRA